MERGRVNATPDFITSSTETNEDRAVRICIRDPRVQCKSRVYTAPETLTRVLL